MANLKNLVDETTNIKNELVECHTNLKNNLIEKGVECSDTDKMSSLIDKITLFDKYAPNPLMLYENGEEYVNITGGYKDSSVWNACTYRFIKSSTDMKIILDKVNPSGYGSMLQILNTKLIDLTLYNKLYFKYEFGGVNGYGTNANFVVANHLDFNSLQSQEATTTINITSSSGTNGIAEIDISSLVGEKCIGASLPIASGVTPVGYFMKITKIWAER